MAERMTVLRKTLSVPAIGTLLLRVIVLTMSAFLFMILTPSRRASGAEFTIQPTLTLSEEYNDNIFLTTTNRQQDYISQAIPSVTLHYKTDLWAWDLDYAYIYRYYYYGKITDDSTQTANLTNKTELIKNTFFVALTDNYSRVSLDVARDYTQESPNVNQSDVNVFNVNPYIVARSATRSPIFLGYQYISTWYKNPNAIDTIEQTEYAEMTTELSSQTTFTTGARYTRNENNLDTFDKLDIYAGPQYTYAPNSYVYATLGNSLLDFDTTGHTSQVFWKAGITHQYSTMTVSFDTGLSYIPDPQLVVRRVDHYIATLKKTTTRTTLQLSGGLTEYRNAAQKYIETTAYSIDGKVTYSLSPTSTVLVDVSAEHLRNYVIPNFQIYSNQDVYLNRLRFEHKVQAKNLTLALEYRYQNAYSPDVYTSNYFNNRVIGEVMMQF
jgi:hypothetical protein